MANSQRFQLSAKLIWSCNCTDKSSGNPRSWDCNFEDGPAHSSDQNPTYTFKWARRFYGGYNESADDYSSYLFALVIVRLQQATPIHSVERTSTHGLPAGDIESLTRRLAAGDETAFSELHTLYFDRLYQFLLIVSQGRADEAQEALQQTLLRVVRYARVFNSEESFWCWLRAVARSAARDAGRKQQRYWGLLKRFAIRAGQVGPCSLNDVDHLLRDELDESLSELASEDRLLLERKYIEGASVKELSSLTGLTEKAIDSRLVRLRRRLRGELLKKLNSP